MNQILISNDENGNSSREVKPVIRFFAIIIIVIALILTGIWGVNLSKSLKNKDNYPKPTINVEKNGSAVNLIIKGQNGINRIEYKWNEGNVTQVKVNGKKEHNLEIEIPQGDNVLNVVVVDVEGNKTKFDKIEVEFAKGEDTIKPEISIVDASGKLRITAIDNSELAYLSYKWEGEEEVKVEPTQESKTTITKDVNVQRGTKKIVITAVDKTGNKAIIENNIIGSDGPKITVRVEDNNFIVNVKDEYVITKIEYTLNEKVNKVEGIPQDAKEFEFKVPLEDGVNYLKINAYENGLMTEYKCKKTK